MSCDRARSLDLAAFLVDPGGSEFEAFRAHYPTCADCTREIERLSRLEGTLRAEEPEAGHPNAEDLLALERHPETLSVSQREALSNHLEGCAPCRTELSALRGFGFAALREGHTPTTQARSPARRAPPPRRRMSRGLMAAALAAGLLIFVALPLYLRRDAGPIEPPVARIEPVPAPEAVAPREPEPEELPETRIVREPVQQPKSEGVPAPAPHEREPVRVAEDTAEPILPQEPVVSQEPAPVQIAMAFPSGVLRYTPPAGTDPLLQRWRVPGVVRSGAGPSVKIQALAPDHTGLTAEASPNLYWVLSASTDLRVELVVTDEIAEEPLLDQAFAGAQAGVHALLLAEHGVVLEPGKTYRWYATVVPDPEDRSSEVVSGGAIERIEPDAALAVRLAEAAPGDRAHLLAEAGLFYDSLDVVSRWIVAYPEAAEPRRDRAALLEAVGLGKALPPEGGPNGPG